MAWAIVIGTIGFTLGSNWDLVQRLISYLGLGGLAVVLAVIVAVLLLRRRAAHTQP
jgi:membrane protein DedA with SNARE-associated domain